MNENNQEFFKKLPFTYKNDPIVSMKIDGYILEVPKSFKESTQELISKVTGGCGPGYVGDWFVPDTMYFLKITPACKLHDWTFQVWNDKESFDVANDLFKRNLYAIIEQHGGWKIIQKLRKRRAGIYVKFVSGDLGYNSYIDNHLKYLMD